MKVQYIYDEKGDRKSAIIPYKEWLKLRKIIPQKKDHNYKFNPKKYFGIYKNLDINLEKEINDLREEWNRNNI